MVDYGVSKRWRLLVDTPCLAQLPTSTSHRDLDDTIAEHVAKAEDGHLAASARYASQNAHMGIGNVHFRHFNMLNKCRTKSP